jgi:hypothetical protein
MLHQFLDRFCIAYLDDITVYSDNIEDHIQHVEQVLTVLDNAGLHLNPKKCVFHTDTIEFLSFIIKKDNISMNSTKIEAVTR